MKRKMAVLLMAAMMTSSLGAGAVSAAEESTEMVTEETSEEAGAELTDEEAAAQLLEDLTGSYIELWPVIMAEEYAQDWLDDTAAVVGDEAAESSVEMLQAMVTGDIYGEEAVEAYKDGDHMAFFCGFTQDVEEFHFDGSVISGTDEAGNEVFSHEYQFVKLGEGGFYEFRTEDADAGEFTWFFLAPDTPQTTWHIEFRYGSDEEALNQLREGDYAYWLASGIPTDYDDEMARNGIELFCTENLQ